MAVDEFDGLEETAGRFTFPDLAKAAAAQRLQQPITGNGRHPCLLGRVGRIFQDRVAYHRRVHVTTPLLEVRWPVCASIGHVWPDEPGYVVIRALHRIVGGMNRCPVPGNEPRMPTIPRLLFTLGDVAGVGPEIIARAWPQLQQICRPVVVGDPDWLRRTLRLVGLAAQVEPIRHLEEARPTAATLPCLLATDQDLSSVTPARVKRCGGQSGLRFSVSGHRRNFGGPGRGHRHRAAAQGRAARGGRRASGAHRNPGGAHRRGKSA